MSALLLIFSMREGTDEASWGSSSLPSSSLKSFSKQLTSLHVEAEPAGRIQYWSDSDAPKPEAMRDAADGKPMARSRSTASGRKSGMPLFLNQIESLSRVMLPYGSTDMSGAWPASKTWVLPVTAWRSWSQVSSATSWSRHMRVSRDSSGGLPSINWLRSFRLPATTCCHSTAWSLATRKPAQRPHLLPVPRDVDDSVLVDNLLLAMPRHVNRGRRCVRERRSGARGVPVNAPPSPVHPRGTGQCPWEAVSGAYALRNASLPCRRCAACFGSLTAPDGRDCLRFVEAP